LTIDNFISKAASRATSIHRKSFVIKELVGRVGSHNLVPDVKPNAVVTLHNVVIMHRPFHVFEFVDKTGVVAFVSQSSKGKNWLTRAVVNMATHFDVTHEQFASLAAARHALARSIMQELALSDMQEAKTRGGDIKVDAKYLSTDALVAAAMACANVDAAGCGLVTVPLALARPDLMADDRDKIIQKIATNVLSDESLVAVLHGVASVDLLRKIVESPYGSGGLQRVLSQRKDWGPTMFIDAIKKVAKSESYMADQFHFLSPLFERMRVQDVVQLLESFLIESKKLIAGKMAQFMNDDHARRAEFHKGLEKLVSQDLVLKSSNAAICSLRLL
jgi:hypothetical protein